MITEEDKKEELSKAIKALDRAKEMEKRRLKSGEWKWVREDNKTLKLIKK